MQEVTGSIPVTSTNRPAAEVAARSTKKRASQSPSSRGLGHRPFTAVTGVRIPVGTPESEAVSELHETALVGGLAAELGVLGASVVLDPDRSLQVVAERVRDERPEEEIPPG